MYMLLNVEEFVLLIYVEKENKVLCNAEDISLFSVKEFILFLHVEEED